MASIYTGLAFMHGHIVDRELVIRLGREDELRKPATPAPEVQPSPAKRRDAAIPAALRPGCATC